jgi:hypothetical protein
MSKKNGKKGFKTDPTPTSTTEGNEPDGFVIVHYPVDGSEPYGVGPFPFIESLAELLVTRGNCPCRKVPLSIAFPLGITMVVHGVDFEEMASVLSALKAMREADEEAPRARPN